MAETCVNYTAFKARTIGFEGFSLLLPAYLDHVLRPKINEASFASEVYRVLGDGKEAGVVFCEIREGENTQAEILGYALRGALFGDTPLGLNIGGLCKDIPTLSNEDIVRFHREQYFGDNVTVIVGGNSINPAALLEYVKPLLDEVSRAPGYNRGQTPWIVPIQLQQLAPASRCVVDFPTPEEDASNLVLGWRGPGIVDRETLQGVYMLMRYLFGFVLRALKLELDEMINHSPDDASLVFESFMDASVLAFQFSNLKHKGRKEDNGGKEPVAGSLMNLLSSLGINELPSGAQNALEGLGINNEWNPKSDEESFLTSGKLEKLVMDFLSNIVEKKELPGGIERVREGLMQVLDNELRTLEADGPDAAQSLLLDEFLFAKRDAAVIGENCRGFPEVFTALLEKDESYWIDLLSKWIVHARGSKSSWCQTRALLKSLRMRRVPLVPSA